MSFDLAIDYGTGDLIAAPNNDLAGRTGPETIQQRIRVRLRIHRGEWLLDPTEGTLGSDLHKTLRMPIGRAVAEVEAAIMHALEPMDDIDVVGVRVTQSAGNARELQIEIQFRPLIEGADETAPPETTILTIPTV